MYFGQNCLLNLSLAGIICFLKNDVNGVIMAKLKVTEGIYADKTLLLQIFLIHREKCDCGLNS